MHAVFITFHSAAGLDDLQEPFREGAEAISEVPGLLSKTWIQDGATLGGFYIFTDEAAARAYLDGPIIAKTKAVPDFSDFSVQQFTVLEAFSAITRGVPGTVVDRAA